MSSSRVHYCSVQFSSVAQSCPTLCNPMNRSTPGLPVHHQLPESSNEYSRLISFRMVQFDLPAVQGTLKSSSAPQFKGINSSGSVFLMIQFSHLYMSIGKTIALTIHTSVDKVIFLLFNMLSRFVIAFLPRSKRLLISWLQSPSTVILEPKKIKSAISSTFSSICHEVMGPDAMIFV